MIYPELERFKAMEISDEEDFYDRINHEGDYENDSYDYSADYDMKGDM